MTVTKTGRLQFVLHVECYRELTPHAMQSGTVPDYIVCVTRRVALKEKFPQFNIISGVPCGALNTSCHYLAESSFCFVMRHHACV